MTDQAGIDNGNGVPVTLPEVLSHMDADGRKSFELALARAQIAKLKAQQQDPDSSPDAPSETP